jgi:single-strand DNA-binding protein
MKMSNFVQLIGHLGQDVKLIKNEDKSAIGKVSIATTSSYKNQKGEKVTKTEWHNLVMFGKIAEIAAEYLSKGSNVLVTGGIKTRTYQKENEPLKYITEIIVDDIIFLDKKD